MSANRKQPVPIAPFRTSPPCRWSVPRQPADTSTRGPILPMVEEPRADWFDWAIRAAMVGMTLGTIIFIYNGGFTL